MTTATKKFRNAQNRTLLRGLHRAARGQHYKKIWEILGTGGNINRLDENGRTVLMLVAIHDTPRAQEEIVRLLSKGAKADIRDKNGQNVFDITLNYGAYSSFVTLVSHTQATLGLPPLTPEKIEDIKKYLTSPAAALHTGPQDLLPVLRILHAISDLSTPVEGQPPLLRAINNQAWQTASALCRLGIGTEDKDENGHTPLIAYTLRKNWSAVSLLIGNGARLDTKTNDGRTLDILLQDAPSTIPPLVKQRRLFIARQILSKRRPEV